ncbi:hypothetical protein [uncultured Dokdonia sp.]|uniref:hypothetical protein n=1 Tax=uncultured Dokdonia sp. TaxID=575653 RepID=UPI002630C409|nr:hypothetical protein [uncultured Dokdonia sp.]
MKKILQLLILVTFSFNVLSQNIIIEPDIKIDSTTLKINKLGYEYYAYNSYDNKKIDSLTIVIGTIGTSVTALKINLTEPPEVYITLWSDYPEYDDKNALDVKLEYYDLTLNDTTFNKDDRVMGRIKGKSEPIKNNLGEYQLEFDGEFSHIVGKLLIKRKANQKYRILDNY